MAQITIYTDGSALGNPGPGGYGAVLLSGPHRKELSQGFRLTTNNRMELTAVCAALEALKFEGSDVTVYSDSKYVVDAVTKGWLFSWVKKRFAGKKNPDLWMEFLREYRKHSVKFIWVKGHASIPGNERCDKLAVAAAAANAFNNAMADATPCLLEPIMKVEAATPGEFVGDVIGDLSRRRADVTGSEDAGTGMVVVVATVPLAEMFGYATALRSLTQGRATYSMEFDHYASVPMRVLSSVIRSV